ncbi:hypothetical protein OHW24_12950 [Acinetobacter baumannii]|nr:hypothetical protein [Acinetobacter baumannii]MDX7929018.1 glycosyltransferase family 2 protein [Acinetobacter baumannii]
MNIWIGILLMLLWGGLCCRSWLRSIRATNWILSEKEVLTLSPVSENICEKKLFVLLPALEEQPIVDETLNYFSKILSPFPNATIIVITGESERVRRDELGSKEEMTNSLVDKWIANNIDHCVIRLHEPALSGTKSTKLQFAWQKLKEQFGRNYIEDSWFAIYDFDSRPPQETFIALARELKNGQADVIQQVPHIAGSEIHEYSSTSASRTQAIAHYERTLCIETDLRREQTGATWEIRYAMGAGLFLKASCLEKTEGFPEYSDDIALGYRLDLLEIPRVVLSVPNMVQPAPSFRALIKQFRRINLGVFSVHKEVEWFLNKNKVKTKKFFILMRVIASHSRSLSNIIRFIAAILASFFVLPNSILLACSFVLIYLIGESLAVFSYSRLMNRVRRSYTNNLQDISLPISGSIIGAFFLGAIQFFFLLDFFIYRIRNGHNVLKVAGDKTKRKV